MNEVRKILHVSASPREERSVSLEIADAFMAELAAAQPGLTVDRHDVWSLDLPELTGDTLAAKYAVLRQAEPTAAQARAWQRVADLADAFARYDGYVVSTPLWNFSLPYQLKKYIDVVTQPGHLFTWTPEQGYRPLLHDKAAVVITASSFDYREGSALFGFDHGSPYLRHWLAFIGVTAPGWIDAGPTFGGGAESRSAARDLARRLAQDF